MGTPTESIWPGLTSLKDYKPTFPKWQGGELPGLCSKIGPDGIDLLKKLLVYDPTERLTPEEALDHPYFKSIDHASYASRDYA